MTVRLPDLRLDCVRADGDWSDFLTRLGGWQRTSDGDWSDGVSTLAKQSSFATPIGISFPPSLGVTERSQPEVRTSPGGIAVLLRPRPAMSADDASRFRLNHASFRALDVSGERRWFEEILGTSTVIARTSAYDPLSKDWRPDAHLFRRPAFYITLRGGDTARLDHHGWMTNSRTDVDLAAEVLSEIGWPIVMGPFDLDGSYLVHFKGPDGQVHDVFAPGADLESDHV